MERSLLTEEEYFVFPSEEEIQAAQAACCGRCCSACETPAAYAWRKRDIDMSVLLETAVKNELSETERKMIEEYFYNSKKLVTIAAERGVSGVAAGKSLERALEKLRHALKYVVMYQHICADEGVVPLAVRRAAAIAQARRTCGETVGERLLSLRMRENLSRKTVEEILGIEPARLGYIERDEKDIYGAELIMLSGFYGVSADYILKGENR